MLRRRYVRLGAALCVAGAFILGASVLLLASYPGISSGMALVVLGLVILLLGKTTPELPAELAQLLARNGYENLGRLLEELGLQSRAVYLPTALLSYGARALIPLGENSCTSFDGRQMDDRLVVSFGDGPDDVGVLVVAPGSAALGLLQSPPGATMDEVSVAVTQVAVSSLRIARSIGLHDYGDRVSVDFVGENAPTGWLSSSVENCLGSLSASVAAAVVAEAKGRRVTIESESVAGSTRTVMLVLLPE
jgi:hypothetical protein